MTRVCGSVHTLRTGYAVGGMPLKLTQKDFLVSVCSHSGEGVYSISIPQYFHRSQVPSGEVSQPCQDGVPPPNRTRLDGIPPVWDRTDGVPPIQDRTGWGTPSETGQDGVPSTPGDRLCLDWLRHGQYASCGFPQEDFLLFKINFRIVDHKRSEVLKCNINCGKRENLK